MWHLLKKYILVWSLFSRLLHFLSQSLYIYIVLGYDDPNNLLGVEHGEWLVGWRLQPVLRRILGVVRLDDVERVGVTTLVRFVRLAAVHHLTVNEDQRTLGHGHRREAGRRIVRHRPVVDEQLGRLGIRIADVSI